MSLLKQVINGGIVGWSDSKKNSFLFAVAQTTTSQELNGDQLLLQIMAFDNAEKGLEPHRLGVTLIQVPATSITWSTFGEDTGIYPYGLICIGHQDGSFVIYDANQIILQTKSNPDVLAYDIGKLCYIKEFSVPVYSTEYNSYKPNLIAIGGDEVLVVDISKDIENPDIIAPGDTNLHSGGTITSVSWNKKVPHILASASNNGVAVVWNLKTSQVSFQIPDIYQHQQGPKQLSLAWNPEIPLQFAINYDDEKKPELHIWDLRDTRGPYVSLENGHIQGIQTLSWCTTNPSLIITGGVDNKVVCWNIKTKEIIQSFYLGTQILNIQWSKIPSLYSVSLADGTIQLYALNQDEIMAHPPKWYLPTVGATFAPSNVLTSFSENTQSAISSKQYQTKDENYQLYLRWFQELEKVIDDNNSTGLCDLKLKNTHVEDIFELDQWRLLRGVAFGNNKEILESLGFKKSEIIKRAEDYTGKKHKEEVEEDNNTNKNTQSKPQKQSIEFTPVNEEQADDFFNNLTATNTQNNAQPTNASTDLNGSQIKKCVTSNEEEVYLTEQVSKNKNWDAGVEKMIKENMIIGNYEGAIDCAMKCGRVAEALLIAYSHNQELFKSTIDQYFTQQTDNFIKYVFKNLIKNDIDDIAENYDLKSWRECAGLAITCSKNPVDFQQLMNKLAERFIKEKNDDDSAICCFILSQNFHRLVEIYFKRIQALRGNIKQRAYYMVQSIEKLLILKKIMAENFHQSHNNRGVTAVQQQQLLHHDVKFDSIILELSKIALSNSRISTAYKILEQGNPIQLHIAELKDLLFNVYFDELSLKFTKPILPYSFVRIPAPQHNSQQHNQNGNQRKTNQANQQNTNNFNNKDTSNKLQNKQTITNPPPVNNNIPVNQQNSKLVPFNPRGGQKEFAPPAMPIGGAGNQFNKPPVVANNPPIQQNHPPIQSNYPPIQSNHTSQNEIQTFNSVPPTNTNQFGNREATKAFPPANPYNKNFTESVGSKNIGPPRPVIDSKKNPVNNQKTGFINNPPLLTENQPPINAPLIPSTQSLNKSLSKINPPPANIHPPVNKGGFVPPPSINNPQLLKQESNHTNPPTNPHQNRQGPNVPPPSFTPSGNNRPNPPVANSNIPFNPSQNGNLSHPVPNQNQFGGIQQNQNILANTRPPIAMNLNNPANLQNQTNNLPPVQNVPPPVGLASAPRTASQQTQNVSYTASPEEIQFIEGYINSNQGIFGQIDPKKKDEHISQLNNLINLLKSGQLKQEQVQLLTQICQEMSSDKQKDALNTHSKLSRFDFSTHKHWLTTLKRLIVQK